MASGSLLRLLVEGAGAASLSQPLERARARGCPPEELARLQQETLDVLQLHAILDEQRRHERELAALFEMVRDLARIRDVERVLAAIVRRVRQLLATDCGILTLVDDTGRHIYSRVSDGTTSDKFQHIRLALGEGIAGMVAETGMPYVTRNYLADGRYQHTDYCDEVVTEEGLVAVLAVPLLLANDVIGVLLAANRNERQFGHEDVSLLSSFASMAAVALENARLFGELQAALDELSRATDVIRAQSAEVERAAEVHATITALVSQGAHLNELARAVTKTLGGSLLIVDPAGTLLGCAEDALDELDRCVMRTGALPDDEAGAALLDAMAEAAQCETVEADMPANYCTRWVAPMVTVGEQLGALVLATASTLKDLDRRTLERAAQVTSLLLLDRRSTMEVRQRMGNEFIDELLTSAAADTERLGQAARLLGFAFDQPYAVVMMSVDASARHAVQRCCADIASDAHGISGVLAGQNVLLLPATVDAHELVGRVRASSTRLVTAGIGGPATGLPGLRTVVAFFPGFDFAVDRPACRFPQNLSGRPPPACLR